MTVEIFPKNLGAKGADFADPVEGSVKTRRQIPKIIRALMVEKGPGKYSCEKALRLLSEKKPEWVYPYFDLFVSMLGNDNSFLRWGAIFTLSNLTSVDRENKFEEIFHRYFKPVLGPEMITAANVIRASAKIVRSKPELADRIVTEILKVETATYLNKGAPSQECRNVVIGKAVDALDQICGYSRKQTRILRFMERQQKNARPPVARKADRFLRKYSAK